MDKKRFIMRFVVVYFCILLPLVIAMILVGGRIVRRMEEKEIEMATSKLERAAVSLESDYFEYKDQAVLLFSNSEFHSNVIASTVSDSLTAIQILKNIWIFNSTDADFLVYYGDGHFYNHKGREGTSVYWNSSLVCTKESIERAEQVIRADTDTVCVLHSKTGASYLLYHMPVEPDSAGKDRSLEIVRPAKYLVETLGESVMHEDAILQIQIGEDQIWFFNSEDGIVSISEEQSRDLIHQRALSALHLENEGPRFKVTLWYDVNQLFAEYRMLRSFSLILLLMGFVLSVGISLTLSINRTRKIEGLTQALSRKGIGTTEKKHRNEFDYIRSLLDAQLQELSSYELNEKEYRPLLRTQAAGLLFHGAISQKEQVESIMSVGGIEFFEDYFFLYGVRLSSEELVKEIESLLYEDLYYIYRSGSEFFFVLLQEIPCLDNDGKLRKRMGKRLKDVFLGSDIQCGTIVISQVYNSVTRAHFAYYEVISMLRQLPGGKPFVTWEDWIQNYSDAYNLVGMEYVDQFRDALNRRSTEDARNVVELVQRSQKSQDIKEYICYLLYQTVLLSINANNYNCSDEVQRYVDLLNDDIKTGFDTKMNTLLTKLFAEQSKDFEQILAYIHENYCSTNFSLNEVASYSGMSVSRLSKFFLAKTGTHYLEYVTELRIEKAKDLLQNTDMSIKDIFLSVGYNDYVNAGRKFKKKYGMSPSEFKLQDQHDTTENEQV